MVKTKMKIEIESTNIKIGDIEITIEYDNTLTIYNPNGIEIIDRSPLGTWIEIRGGEKNREG